MMIDFTDGKDQDGGLESGEQAIDTSTNYVMETQETVTETVTTGAVDNRNSIYIYDQKDCSPEGTGNDLQFTFNSI